jgi:hypothetical protein
VLRQVGNVPVVVTGDDLNRTDGYEIVCRHMFLMFACK